MKNILKIFKRKFISWWVVLFLLVAFKLLSNTNNVVAYTSLVGVIGYIIGYCFGTMFGIIIFSTPLYALVGLISKKWEALTIMIIITALTLLYITYS